MSVASWYFARHKSHVGSLTVVSSVGKTFTFHIGTAAFGGLIVAIVETAIFSTNFCTSARNAFYLIARNIARVAAVSILGEFVLNVMTLFVCVVTTLGVYVAMDSNIRSQLNSLVGPTIMTAVLAYYTGKMVTAVYGMAITTILQCFVADEELFPPSQQFAENDLRGWVDKHGAPMEVDSGPRQQSSRTGANQYAFS
ncbi:unnamed protein product [Ectocarpus sp. 12 AP-2014]